MLRRFVDTNIWVYPFDRGEPGKSEQAERALATAGSDLVISTQVLLEFYVVVTRKLNPPLSNEAATEALTRLSELPVVATDAQLVQRAAATSQDHQLSMWDAMIVEAAFEAGCDQIWTEDLANGSMIRGIEIVNPLI